MLHVAGADLAQKRRIEVIAALGFLQRQIDQPLVQIALDGAPVDPEFFGQRLWVKPFALVQLDQ